jgi:hypothetical protein
MKIYQFIVSSFLIILGCVNVQCSDDQTTGNNQKFVGDWKIAEVLYDGVLQDNWTGATLTFTQLTADSGAYYLPQTPYDSIWNSVGNWKKQELKDLFYREDKIKVYYWVNEANDEMIFDFYLPWTQQSTCVDGVCLPVVTGQWTFKLDR